MQGMQGDRRTEVLEGEPGVQSPCERGWAGVRRQRGRSGPETPDWCVSAEP